MKFTKLIIVSVMLSLPQILTAQCSFSGNIETIAGDHTSGYSGDGGLGTGAQMGSPFSVAVSPVDEDLYIADYFNNCVRRVSHTDGVISTYVGTGIAGYNGDGLSALTTQLNGPTGLVFDTDGNLYIADKYNERIRKVDHLTGLVSSVAGNGLHGGGDDGAGGEYEFGNDGPATAAALTYPIAMAFDCGGNMFIADQGSHTVRRVDNATQIITRFAGNHISGFVEDGVPATATSINQPSGIAVDCATNKVYISDTWNDRIRLVNSAGIISTVVGNGSPGYSGDGGSALEASIFGPWGIMLDACGDLYICDYDNYVVRKVTGGNITTVAGINTRGYSGNGGNPADAEVYLPASIASSAAGVFYIADYGNYVVRSIGAPVFAGRAINGGTTQTVHVCKNSTGLSIDKLLATKDETALTESWAVSIAPLTGTLIAGTNTTAANGVVMPAGFVYVPANGFIGRDEFTVRMSDGTSKASTTITVWVDEAPDAGVITQKILAGDTILLSSSGYANGTWTSTDPLIATVDTNGKVTPVSNGTVIVSYTVASKCGSASASTAIVSHVPEIAGNKMIVFPNPSNGSFRFDLTSIDEHSMQLIATDATGRVVHIEKLNAVKGINNFNISLPSTLPRLSYLWLSLYDDKGRKNGSTAIMLQK
jgi:hypothetical protein